MFKGNIFNNTAQFFQKPTLQNLGRIVEDAVPNPVKTINNIKNTIENPTPQNILNTISPPLTADAAQVIENITVHSLDTLRTAIENPTLANLLNADPLSQLPGHTGPMEVVIDAVEIIAAAEQGIGKVLEKGTQMLIKGTLSGLPINVMVETNLASLQSQVKEWKTVPDVLIKLIQVDYKTDLAKVRYAENIDTHIANTAIAFPGQIFFPRSIDPLHNENDLHWLLHELTHQDQYVRVGGFKNYVDLYASDLIMKGIKEHTFSPHDHLDFEKEADNRADALTPSVWQELSVLIKTFAP